MANFFKRKLSRNIGATLETVGSYTVPVSNVATVIGLGVSNISGANTEVDVTVNNSTVDFYVVKNAPLPYGGTLVAVGGDQKIVLEAGDGIKVKCSTGNVDVVMSILETTL